MKIVKYSIRLCSQPERHTTQFVHCIINMWCFYWASYKLKIIGILEVNCILVKAEILLFFHYFFLFTKKRKVMRSFYLLLAITISSYIQFYCCLQFYMYSRIIYYNVLNISVQNYYYYCICMHYMLNLMIGIINYLWHREYSNNTISKNVSAVYINFPYQIIYIS